MLGSKEEEIPSSDRREWFLRRLTDPGCAIGIGLILMIESITPGPHTVGGICGSILFGCGVIAAAIRAK